VNFGPALKYVIVGIERSWKKWVWSQMVSVWCLKISIWLMDTDLLVDFCTIAICFNGEVPWGKSDMMKFHKTSDGEEPLSLPGHPEVIRTLTFAFLKYLRECTLHLQYDVMFFILQMPVTFAIWCDVESYCKCNVHSLNTLDIQKSTSWWPQDGRAVTVVPLHRSLGEISSCRFWWWYPRVETYWNCTKVA
jgi:hypothetical protein